MTSTRPSKLEEQAIVRYIRTLATDASNVKQGDLVKRGQIYYQLLKSHASQLNAVNNGQEIKYVAACVLAGNYLSHHISREQAIKMSGLKAKDFDRFLSLAGELLKVNTSLSIKDIAIPLGLEPCIPLAVKLLAAFKDNYGGIFEGVPEVQSVAAAVFLVAEKLRLKPNKKELVTISKLKPYGFGLLVDQMRTLYAQVADDLPQTSSKKRKRALRKNSSDEKASDEDERHTKQEDDTTETDWPVLKLRILREAFLELQKSDPALFKTYMSKYKTKLPEGFSLH